jgi:hypothetical protein
MRPWQCDPTQWAGRGVERVRGRFAAGLLGRGGGAVEGGVEGARGGTGPRAPAHGRMELGGCSPCRPTQLYHAPPARRLMPA